VAGEVDELLTGHRLLTGPAAQADQHTERLAVVRVQRAERQARLLVRLGDPVAGRADLVPPGFQAEPVSLEELVLAYLREPAASALPGPSLPGTPDRAA
jgi:ABC-2 type transport system ATP-binding protein